MEPCIKLDKLFEKHPLPWSLGWDRNAGQHYYKDAGNNPVSMAELIDCINDMGDWSQGCPFCGDSR